MYFPQVSKTCLLLKKSVTKRFVCNAVSQITQILQGQGTKNIVVFGNSHAYKAFIGIVQIFKPIAKHITLISTPACVPGSKEHQHHTLYQVSYHIVFARLNLYNFPKFRAKKRNARTSSTIRRKSCNNMTFQLTLL
jgi:hypothetical protein